MLMQTDGRKILLLPAWPKEWEVDFKLHAPYRTVVSGHVKQGKFTKLSVEPAARRKDISFMSNDQY
jgi:alpha-L-fucosidase 2